MTNIPINWVLPFVKPDKSKCLATIGSFLAIALWCNATSAQPFILEDLGTLGGTEVKAYDINDSAEVVGQASTAGNAGYPAFLWDAVNGMQNLGTLGGNSSAALDISENGQVVGWADTEGTDPETHAFVWDALNGMQDLGTLGGNNSEALAVNEHGQVVGWAETSSVGAHAFVWDAANGMQDLGTLGGSYSEAFDINDNGQVVGFSSTAGDAEFHGFLWDAVNGLQDLGTLGGSNAGAVAINANGQIIGSSSTPGDAEFHAFVWDAVNGIRDLGTLGGTYSEAFAINAGGQIVGQASTAGDGTFRAFVWDPVNGMQNLGTPGGADSKAVDINGNGQVVGRAYRPGSSKHHAFLWDPATGMHDLGTLGGNESEAVSINERGQIAGNSSTANDAERHAFLATESPEISSECPLSADDAGAAGLLALRRQLQSLTDDPATPHEVAEDLEDKVLKRINAAFDDFLKGRPHKFADDLRKAIKKLEDITDDEGYDTSTLQGDIATLAVSELCSLIARVGLITGPSDDDFVDAQDELSDALRALADGDFEHAAEHARHGSKKIKDPDYVGNFCPAEQTDVYSARVCEIQTAHDAITELFSSSRDDKLRGAGNKLRRGLRKAVVIDIKEAAKKFRDTGEKLAEVTSVNPVSLLEALSAGAAGLLSQYLSDAELSAHDPDDLLEARQLFTEGELARGSGAYLVALDRYKEAAAKAKP